MKDRMKNSRLSFLFLVGISVVSTSLAIAQPGLPQLQQKLPIDPNVKVARLSNGLTYYIRKNSKPENKVELRLVINAGSILEDDDQQGLAHFTEHMAFNGTKNFKKNDLVSYLQTIGVEFGADLNAQTGFDETIYILPIPTEKKENVEKGFQILEDWASTVAFDPAEIDKERGIVLEESRQGKGADDRIFRKVYPKLFEGSKYANRLPIGQEEILKTFKPEVIKRFYSDWYRPNNMAVIVVGDIELAEAEALIKKHFEKLKNASKPKTRTLTELPKRKVSEGFVATDKEATNHMVSIYYPSVKAKEETTVGDYRQLILRQLFSSMMSQRMQELTQQANPPFLFGGNTIGGFVRGYEGYQSYAYLTKEGPEPAINALVQEGLRIKQFGFTAAELDRTKKMVMKGMERAFNERDKTESANFVDEYVGNFLEKETIPGIENEFNYYKQFIDGITLDEVNSYGSQNIPASTEPKLVLLTGPESSDFAMPDGQQLLAFAEKAGTAEIKPYEEKTVASTLLEKTPTPGSITAEKENKEIGFTEISFANGVKVILKPTDFKNDQVLIAGTRFGGQHLYPVSERVNTEFASTIVGQMGVGNFSPTDLRKFLAGKSVGVNTRIGSISETVNGQCSATDIETMLQLTYLYFTKPRADKELFTSFVTKQQALYQNMTADPEYVFQDSMLTILYKKHPWAPRLPKAEMFNQLDQQRAMEIYKERFSNANGFTFVIVGAFDVAKIKPMLTTYLGGLPSNPVAPTFKDAGVRPIKGPLKKEIKKGTEPKSLVRLMWNGEAKFSGDENLKLQALGEVLTIRIIEKLREELGQIYSGGAYGSLNKLPYESYTAGVSFPCGPENVDKLISVTLAEIEKVKTTGPTKEDLDKVRETWKQQYQVSIKDNSFWLRGLIQAVENGSDPQRILTYPQRVDALTPKDLQNVAVKYFDMKNYVQFVLNPEN
jgi:zinc protease